MKKIKISYILENIQKDKKNQQIVTNFHWEKTNNPYITNIAYDSRKVSRGSIFFAIKGFHTDGHLYIEDAIKRGAVTIVHSKELSNYNPAVVYIRTENPRILLSVTSHIFYGRPSEKLTIIGVTGTDGKSSTVWFTHQLLSEIGQNSGFISTVHFLTGKKIVKNELRQSTPEAPEIHEMLYTMLKNGKRYAVIEATSHGLSDRTARLKDVDFDTAVLTNVTHEHLEFHGSIENYRNDKANLFRRAKDVGVINLDDANWRYFYDAFYSKKEIKPHTTNNGGCFLYSTEPLSWKTKNNPSGERAILPSIYANNIESDLHGTTFDLSYRNENIHLTQKVSIPLPGAFNVSNVLASLLAVIKTYRTTEKEIQHLISMLPKLKGVPGRMEHIRAGQPFNVIVDYAHTPESFKKVLPFFKQYTQGRLITVFGSAGERDIEKRPKQGKIAATYSDIVIVTDEDPRGEDRMKIINEIVSGAKGVKEAGEIITIPDRKEAIERAFQTAKPQDTVVLLGKGHEGSIIYDGYSTEWDEIGVARTKLEEMGYTK